MFFYYLQLQNMFSFCLYRWNILLFKQLHSAEHIFLNKCILLLFSYNFLAKMDTQVIKVTANITNDSFLWRQLATALWICVMQHQHGL